MTKEKILDYFKDINVAYNECTRYDDLKRMLDELQEPCEDAISRQAVLDLIDADWKYEGLEEPINSLPSVNPKQSWIPVNESLPDVGNGACKCLVAIKTTSRDYPCETFVAYFDGIRFRGSNNARCVLSGVKAWMPLPEPYKEEEE